MRRQLRLAPLLLVFASCGPSTNVNKFLFVSSSDTSRRTDNLMELAKVAYDDGDYVTATTLGEKILAGDPGNEKVAQFVASSYLGLSGVSPFDLILKIVKKAIADQAAAATGGSSSSNSFDIFGTLAELLNIESSDYSILGTADGLDTDSKYSDYFGGLPVYIPKVPGDSGESTSVRGTQSTLKNISKALSVLCPFLPTALATSAHDKIADDRYSCTYVGKPAGAQTYLIFALSHLVETVFFYSVLLYNEPSVAQLRADTSTGVNVSSNLLSRVTNLKAAGSDKTNVDITKVATFTSAVILMKTTIDQVFDLSDTNSMLSETLADLNITILGFSNIPSLPDSVVTSLKSVLSTVENQAKTISGAKSDIDAQNQAFAQNLSTSIDSGLVNASKSYLDTLDTKLKSQGTTLQAQIDAHPEQKESVKEMCSSLTELASVNKTLTVPSHCSTLTF